jgi:hypothetical protein
MLDHAPKKKAYQDRQKNDPCETHKRIVKSAIPGNKQGEGKYHGADCRDPKKTAPMPRLLLHPAMFTAGMFFVVHALYLPSIFYFTPHVSIPLLFFLNRIQLHMNLLAIETSSPVLSIALKKHGGKIRHGIVKGYMKHAENLLPVIDRLLKKEKLEIGDIDTFLISRGPGSFTGLRIGFATLKGFLATCPKPCYGALSLDVIAAGIKPAGTDLALKGHENLTVCLDARRGKLYTRSYRYN